VRDYIYIAEKLNGVECVEVVKVKN